MKYINKKNDTEFRNNMERDNDKKRKNNTHKDNMDRNNEYQRIKILMEMQNVYKMATTKSAKSYLEDLIHQGQ